MAREWMVGCVFGHIAGRRRLYESGFGSRRVSSSCLGFLAGQATYRRSVHESHTLELILV
jgi:hypothetical protein